PRAASSSERSSASNPISGPPRKALGAWRTPHGIPLAPECGGSAAVAIEAPPAPHPAPPAYWQAIDMPLFCARLRGSCVGPWTDPLGSSARVGKRVGLLTGGAQPAQRPLAAREQSRRDRRGAKGCPLPSYSQPRSSRRTTVS